MEYAVEAVLWFVVWLAAGELLGLGWRKWQARSGK